MKIELGGGCQKSRGDGFVNLDALPCADIQIDFEKDRLPFEDNSVDEVYSSHCLEHVTNLKPLLNDVLRVCKVGAKLELRFPHWSHQMAMSPTHVHVLSDKQVTIWCDQPERWFPGAGKKLVLDRIHYEIETTFFEVRKLLPPEWTDEQIARLFPGCSHEIHAHLIVASHNEIVGTDFDGVFGDGFRPAFDEYVIVTGRMERFREQTESLAEGHAVYLRSFGADGDEQSAGQHKADTINRLGITLFYEDSRTQAAIIRKSCPNCRVVMVTHGKLV